MSDISKIRTLIADPIQYDRAEDSGDAVTTDFALPNSPVVPDSQTVTVNGVTKTEGSDYTFDDAIGLCTFVAAPANTSAVAITYRHSILSDAQIQELLDLEGDVHSAAAAALESIAASEVLIQKRIKQLDLSTDGPAEASELRELAKSMRARAAISTAGFEIAEMVTDDFSLRERLEAESLRNQ